MAERPANLTNNSASADDLEVELQRVIAEATQESVERHNVAEGGGLMPWTQRTADQFANYLNTPEGIEELVCGDYFLGLGDYVYPSVMDDIILLFEERKRRPINLVLFLEGIGSGKTCTSEDSLIPTEQGILSIAELADVSTVRTPLYVPCNGGFLGLKPGEGLTPIDLLVSGLDGASRAKTLYKRDDATLQAVTLQNGAQLKATPDHPLMVMRDGRIQLKPIEQLKIGDCVGVCLGSDLWGQETRLPAVHTTRTMTYDITLPTRLTPELAYIMGVLVGDGCLTRPGWTTLANIDPEVIDRFRAFGKGLGLVAKQSSSQEAVWVLRSKKLTLFWQALGMCHKGLQKRIPDCIMRAPKWAVKEFISGLFDAAGAVGNPDHKGLVNFGQKSGLMMRQLQTLLANFGIYSTITYRNTSTLKKKYPSWLMHIRGQYALRFHQEIGFKIKRKAYRVFCLPQALKGDPLPPLSAIASRLYAKFPPELRTHKIRCGIAPLIQPGSGLGVWNTTIQTFLDRCPKELHTDPDYIYLSLLAEANIRWVPIKEIADAGQGTVYDIEVPGQSNFVCNSMHGSNTKFSILQFLQWFELCMTVDPQAHYRLAPGSTIALINLSRTESQARRVAFGEVWRRFQCPFVRDYFTPNPRFTKEIHIPQNNTLIFAGTSSAMSALGYNLYGGGIDEACFLEVVEDSKRASNQEKYDAAEEIYNAIWDRMTSRFMRAGDVPGMLVMFSSPRYPEDFLERKIRQALELGDESGIFFRRRSTWSAKGRAFYPSNDFFFVDVDTLDVVTEEAAIASGELIFLDHDVLPPQYDQKVQAGILMAQETDRGVKLIPTQPSGAPRSTELEKRIALAKFEKRLKALRKIS